MSVASTCFLLAFFFTAYALAFVWLRVTTPETERKHLLNPKNLAFAFILLYVALAHFSVLTGIAYSVEKDTAAPCENIISQTSLNETNNITTYTYADSCAGDARPATLEVLYKLVGYLIYGGLLFMFIGAIYLIFSSIGGRYW